MCRVRQGKYISKLLLVIQIKDKSFTIKMFNWTFLDLSTKRAAPQHELICR